MADQILNVWLYDNPLTPEINDYTGRVQLKKTVFFCVFLKLLYFCDVNDLS